LEKRYKQILTVLTLILLASPVMLITNSAEAKGSPEAADALYSILDNTKNEVDDLFDDIEGRNENVPTETQEKYSEAMDKWEESKASYDAGEYEEAIEKATEAANASIIKSLPAFTGFPPAASTVDRFSVGTKIKNS